MKTLSNWENRENFPNLQKKFAFLSYRLASDSQTATARERVLFVHNSVAIVLSPRLGKTPSDRSLKIESTVFTKKALTKRACAPVSGVARPILPKDLTLAQSLGMRPFQTSGQKIVPNQVRLLLACTCHPARFPFRSLKP